MSGKERAAGAVAAASGGANAAPRAVQPCCGNGDCEKSTNKIAQVAKSLAGKEDPRYWFANIHACISHNLCLLVKEKKFTDPAWGEKINVFFVNEFTRAMAAQASGGEVAKHWALAFANCEVAKRTHPPRTAIMSCGEQMAFAHITVDLKNALVKYGIGSDRDYDLIGGIVLACSKMGVDRLLGDFLGAQVWSGAPGLQGLADMVPEWRRRAREQARREISGKK